MSESVSIIITPMRYFSRIDEDFMFGWLDSIKCIKGYKGSGRELIVDIDRQQVSTKDIQELIALFKRYGIENIDQLNVFK